MCFLKVAEMGSFSKAAQALGVTTTAVSKQVKSLECSLGEQLFRRTTRRVFLTEFGERLFDRGERVKGELDSFDVFIASNRDEPEGSLKVLVNNALSKSFILEHLKEYVEAYPRVSLDILFSDGDQLFEDESIDVMVGFPMLGISKDPLKYHKLFDCDNILVATPEYVEKYGALQKIEDLLTARIITHTLRKPAHLIPLDDGSFVTTSQPILRMNDFAALTQACVDGLGVFLAGDVMVDAELKSGQLLRFLPELRLRRFEIFLFYRAYDYELPKIRSLVDFVVQKNSYTLSI